MSWAIKLHHDTSKIVERQGWKRERLPTPDRMDDYCDIDDWRADVAVDVNIDVYGMLVMLAANQDVPVE